MRTDDIGTDDTGSDDIGTDDTGRDIPEWTVTPGLIDTVMYAAAMWEFQRLHFDDEWARQEGLERPIVQGPLLGNYLTRTVDEQLDGAFEIEQITWRNRATVGVGETLTCGGTLFASDTGPATADLWITDHLGSVVISGSARLRPPTPKA